MNNVKNIPKLRFPEFNDIWQDKKFRDILTIKSGLGFKASEYSRVGGVPLLQIENIKYGKISWKNHVDMPASYLRRYPDLYLKEGDIVLALNRPVTNGQLKIARLSIVDSPAILYQRVGKFIVKEGNDSGFVFHLCSVYIKDHVTRKSMGSDQPFISLTSLYKDNVRLPIKDEQQKIADFLTDVDDKIAAIDKKIDLLKKYKKGVMQKIFTQQIRFKDDDGNEYPEWRTRVLGDIFSYEQPTKYIVNSTEYNNSYKVPVLTAGKTFILGYTNEADGVYSDLPVVIFDDFTTANHYVDFRFKVKSSAMKILKPRKNVNARVAYEILNRIDYVSGDHKRHWIGEFQDFSIELPSHQEQKKIAEFLISLDYKIKTEEDKLTAANKFKSALLQRMFV